MMLNESRAYFRLPDHTYYNKVSVTAPTVLQELGDLSGRCGFVLAPFRAEQDAPLLLFETDTTEVCALPEVSVPMQAEPLPGSTPTEEYAAAFAQVEAALRMGEAEKVVLSRCADVAVGGIDAEEVFFRACAAYPHLFVALIHSPLCGTWLMATPEALLRGTGGVWHTMALAGTKAADSIEAWSDKNISEQAYVARYIEERLKPQVCSLSASQVYTAQAAGLCHLRTDFRFEADAAQLPELLAALHPTPAVCGIPQAAAQGVISRAERHVRRYYSGFCGWIGQERTDIFVSLRCMELLANECKLYAGGGILRESTMGAEWQETEAKMQTMKRLIK